MRKIESNEEFKREIDEGTGFTNFMGGVSSKNGREILIYGSNPTITMLFEKEEVGNEEWEKAMEMQRQEGKEYAAQCGYLNYD